MQTVNDKVPMDVPVATSAEAAIAYDFQQERLLTARAERRLKEHALTQQRILLALLVVLFAVTGPQLLGGALASSGGWALVITALLRGRR